jgi:hypothetical protein
LTAAGDKIAIIRTSTAKAAGVQALNMVIMMIDDIVGERLCVCGFG